MAANFFLFSKAARAFATVAPTEATAHAGMVSATENGGAVCPTGRSVKQLHADIANEGGRVVRGCADLAA